MNDTDFDEYLKNNPLCNLITGFEFKNAIVKNGIHFNFEGNPSCLYKSNEPILIKEFMHKDIFIFNCKFKDLVSISIKNNKTKIQFVNCIFEKKLIIDNSSDEKNDDEIILLNCQIYNLSIIGNYESIFSIYHSIINFFNINNTYFQNLVQFIDISILNEIKIENSYFKKTTIFDNCIFNKNFLLKYINFESFTYFRNSEFKEGINLDFCNFEKDVNFYGVKGLDSKTSKQNTSQETYRIIKNQFEKLNNKIEANKYHALEMEQHRRNIWERIFNDCNSFLKLLPDGIVLFIHKLSSNHSNNWFLALFWIFIVSFVTSWSLDSVTVDNVFKYINILSKIEDFNCSYIAMTLNKVSLGYLYYQFLTAVRKDTRK